MKHLEFALGIFDKIEQIDSSLSSNRAPIEQYLKNFVSGHENAVKKYGNTEALDGIFIRETAEYYKAVIGIPVESFARIAALLVGEERLPGFEIPTEECLIVYPSFKHAKKADGTIEHTATIGTHILNGTESAHLNPNLNDKPLDMFAEVIRASTLDLAEIWTKDKNATKEEISLIADEILAMIMIENEAAYRKDILTYLAGETDNSQLLRFLK